MQSQPPTRSVGSRRSYATYWLPVMALIFIVLLSITPPVPHAMADTTSFGERRPFGKAGETCSVAVADLDADGHLDVITGGCKGKAGVIYFNPNGNGRFPADTVQIYRPAQDTDATTSVAPGDVDGDGDLDIVTGNMGDGGAQNVVYLNNDGRFSPTSTHLFGPEDSQTESVALGDLNGDGALDIVTGNTLRANMVYLNDGKGTFPTAGEQLPGATDSIARNSVALGDLNNDGLLDIMIGNDTQQSFIYFNNGSGDVTTFTPQPIGSANDAIMSVALGDLNTDGALDIIVGNIENENIIYFNDGTGDFSHKAPLTISNPASSTDRLAIGDINGDGVLDIVAGHIAYGRLVADGLQYTTNSGPTFGDNLITASVALGDLNEDGALDIVAGSDGQGAIFFNTEPGRSGNLPALEISWVGRPAGDLDRNGYLDLIGWDADTERMAVYLNNQGSFPDSGKRPFGPVQWEEKELDHDTAVGDLNNDGHLDIVTVYPHAVYLNEGNGAFSDAQNFGPEEDSSGNVALGDLDNDGDLDIVVADRHIHYGGSPTPEPEFDSGQNMVYRNDGRGNFPVALAYAFGADDYIFDVDLGDLDNDGDLDIIVSAQDPQSLVYLNDGTGDFSGATVRPLPAPRDNSPVARELADLDGDGSLDIVSVYEGQAWIDFNDGTGNFPEAQAHFFGAGDERAVHPGDIDGDGDIDLVMDTSRIYRNDGSGHFLQTFQISDEASTVLPDSVVLGDVNNDGALDFMALHSRIKSPALTTIYLNHLARPSGLPNNSPQIAVSRPGSVPDAPRFSTPEIMQDVSVTVPFTLADPEGDPVREVRAFFSLNGGGSWQSAIPTTTTITTNLAAAPEGSPHMFTWDLFASGVFGQSDHVVFRIEAYPGHTPAANGVPGPYHYASVAAQSAPFRVRGTQVQVTYADSAPASAALVYRLPQHATQGAEPFRRSTGEPFRTDGQGFLQGRGVLTPGDRLVALAPITSTATYTLYLTSAAPTATGLETTPVITPGVQILTVAPDKPLILFNLDVALEWDASNDSQYLARLAEDFQRASAVLYDWTDGQVALGDVTIHHDRGPARENGQPCDPDTPDDCLADYWWNRAHVRIYATNRLRPNANQGGIVTRPISETLTVNGEPKTITYEPGQIRIGAVWNRYGEASGIIGEDWPRTLAHELGHYVLFLDDNYLGFDPDGQLIPVQTCAGAMADPYIDNSSELRPSPDWLPDCIQTLSHQETGRADWATIAQFYDWENLGRSQRTFSLNQPATFNANPGPNILPLNVTQMRDVAPMTSTSTLATPIFYLTDESGVSVQPDPNSQVVLFQPDRQRLIDLGHPVLDRVDAYGARPNDRLCVYNLTQNRLGCEQISASDQQIELITLTQSWQPDLTITPVTSRTVDITVEQVEPGLTLTAQLYPTDAPATPPITLTEREGRYSGTFTLEDPAFSAYVHVRVDTTGQPREIVSDYAIGGNPGGRKSRNTPGTDPGGRKSRNVPRNNPGGRKSRNVPVLSTDGQAILYTQAESFAEGEFYALQSTQVATLPPWTTQVGQAYRLTATRQAPGLTQNTALSISYLSSEVPSGTEGGIKIYFRAMDEADWQPLETHLDTERNEAAAHAHGPGVYVLMTGVALQSGWNLFAYPWTDSQPVHEALKRINAQGYTTVYGHVSADTVDPWKVYDINTPTWVNDLQKLAYGQGYWIRVTDMPSAPQTRSAIHLSAGSVPVPPATYYARMADLGAGTVPANTAVVARVAGTVCGETKTFASSTTGDQVVFTINVPADDGGTAAGCGAPRRVVTFEVAGTDLPINVTWDNSRPRDLAQWDAMPASAIYLPLIAR